MTRWAGARTASFTTFILAAVSFMPMAALAEPDMTRLHGSWSGEYVCNQGRTGLTLTIGRSEPADVSALFHFYAAPGNTGVPTGCFEMKGVYDPTTGDLKLRGGNWLLRPNGYAAVDFDGNIDPSGTRFEGRVIGFNCSTFQLSRRPSPRTTPAQCRPDLVASAKADF